MYNNGSNGKVCNNCCKLISAELNSKCEEKDHRILSYSEFYSQNLSKIEDNLTNINKHFEESLINKEALRKIIKGKFLIDNFQQTTIEYYNVIKNSKQSKEIIEAIKNFRKIDIRNILDIEKELLVNIEDYATEWIEQKYSYKIIQKYNIDRKSVV